MKLPPLLLLFLASVAVHAQTGYDRVAGTYNDALATIYATQLTLRPNGTFVIETVDETFPYTFEQFTNKGEYSVSGDSIILNPGVTLPATTVELQHRESGADTLRVNIDYTLATYTGSELTFTDAFQPQMLSVYINEKKNFTHIVKEELRQVCLFAPKVRRQVVLDEAGVLKLAKTSKYFKNGLRRIGIYSYGFDEIRWFSVPPDASTVTVAITQPVEANRMPMDREVIFRKGELMYYKYQGKIDKSLTRLRPLKGSE